MDAATYIRISVPITIAVCITAFIAGYAIRVYLSRDDGLSDAVVRGEQLTVRVDQLTRELGAAKKESAGIAAELESARDQLENTKRENNKLKSAITESESLTAELRRANSALRGQIEQSQQIVTGLSDELDGSAGTLGRSIERVRTINAVLEKYDKQASKEIDSRRDGG